MVTLNILPSHSALPNSSKQKFHAAKLTLQIPSRVLVFMFTKGSAILVFKIADSFTLYCSEKAVNLVF